MKPRTEDFDAQAAKESPEEFVLSRNLRRRHLSVVQKAAITLEWPEQIELSADPEEKIVNGRHLVQVSGFARIMQVLSRSSWVFASITHRWHNAA